MDIKRSGSQPSGRGPADWFTGTVGWFFVSDNTCPHCHAGYQTSCQHKEFVGGAQAPSLRVPRGWHVGGYSGSSLVRA
jgi:D-arabinose 1-dehydrogenase-like Zn-dependent alcohol dehydrogenase